MQLHAQQWKLPSFVLPAKPAVNQRHKVEVPRASMGAACPKALQVNSEADFSVLERLKTFAPSRRLHNVREASSTSQQREGLALGSTQRPSGTQFLTELMYECAHGRFRRIAFRRAFKSTVHERCMNNVRNTQQGTQIVTSAMMCRIC